MGNLRFAFKNGVEVCLSQPPELAVEGKIIVSAFYREEPISHYDVVVTPEQLVEKLNDLSAYDLPLTIDFAYED